jgi:hypothetical protein
VLRSQLYDKLAVDQSLLRDKRKFYRDCLERGCRTKTVADFENGKVNWWSSAWELPQADLFSKEAASQGGAGAARWKYRAQGRWSDTSGRLFDEHALVRHLAQLSTAAPLILQENVRNHPDLTGLEPSGLCTVRFMTGRTPESTTATPILAAFRMPAGGHVADNFDGEVSHALYLWIPECLAKARERSSRLRIWTWTDIPIRERQSRAAPCPTGRKLWNWPSKLMPPLLIFPRWDGTSPLHRMGLS